MRLEGPDRDAVLAVFAREVTARSARINQELAKLEKADEPGERNACLEALAHQAHNLRGAAAVVQLDVIEAFAAEVEREAERLKTAAFGATGDLVRVTLRLVARLERMAVEAAVAAPSPSPEKSAQEGPIVLHIEDSLSNLKLVERILALRDSPVRLVEAQTGEQGLELARSLRPALVLLDLRLPDMSGEEVLRGLRADPATRTLRVIVISAEARPSEAQRLIDLGADDYLVKPIEVDALLEVVDEVLRADEP